MAPNTNTNTITTTTTTAPTPPRSTTTGRSAAEAADAGRKEPAGRGSRRGPGGGPGGMWFGGPRFGGGRRPRGDVRLAILALLGESPMHGYQMIQEITERSGGRWAPSPGSVYPTLQALEDEGLVVATKSEGKRVYELTDAGRAQLDELGERAQAPWDLGDGDPVGARDLAEQMAQLAGAFKQVMHHGIAGPDRQGRHGAERRPPVALPDPRRRGSGRPHRLTA